MVVEQRCRPSSSKLGEIQRAVYVAKKSAEEERFSNIIGKEDRKKAFKIAKQIKAEIL